MRRRQGQQYRPNVSCSSRALPAVIRNTGVSSIRHKMNGGFNCLSSNSD